MKTLFAQLIKDEAGFIISAELILVTTITVLSMVVGLSELANNINKELEDVASAFGAINQSYSYNGLAGHNGWTDGSFFDDRFDFCDDECDIVGTDPRPEYY